MLPLALFRRVAQQLLDLVFDFGLALGMALARGFNLDRELTGNLC